MKPAPGVPLRCLECMGKVSIRHWDALPMETYSIHPPALLNINIPTCEKCNHVYPGVAQNEELVQILARWYQHHSTLYFRAYVQSIQAQHGISELYVCHLLWMSRDKMKRLLDGKSVPPYDTLSHARFVANCPELARTRLKEMKFLSYG